MGPGLRRGNGEGCEGRHWNLPQEAAAARLGITRPRLNNLLRGKLGKVSLDALVNLATAAGLRLEIRVEVAASGAVSCYCPAIDLLPRASESPSMKR